MRVIHLLRTVLAATVCLAATFALAQAQELPPLPGDPMPGYAWVLDAKRHWLQEPLNITGLVRGQWHTLQTVSNGKLYAIQGTLPGIDRPLLLLIDSGSTYSYLDESLAPKVTGTVDGGFETQKMSWLDDGNGVKVRLNYFALDMTFAKDLISDKKVDGILGIDSIRSLVWRFNYKEKSVSIRRQDDKESLDNPIHHAEVHVRLHDEASNRFFADLSASGLSFRAVVDTGADSTSLPFAPAKDRVIGKEDDTTIHGVFNVDKAVVEEAQLGTEKVPWLIATFQLPTESPIVFGPATSGAEYAIFDWIHHDLWLSFSDHDFQRSLTLSILLIPIKAEGQRLSLDFSDMPNDPQGSLSMFSKYALKSIGRMSSEEILDAIDHPSKAAKDKLVALANLMHEGVKAVLTDGTQSIEITLKREIGK